MIKKFVKVLANLKNDPIMGYIDITTRFGLIDAIDKDISGIN
jgi:hypothetical protein